MKTEILDIEEITKDIVLYELSNNKLDNECINEYLDIICAINSDQHVYNIITNKGEYIMYVNKYNE